MIKGLPSEYLASGSRHKAIPNSGNVNEILSAVIPDNDGVHAVCARNVATDHKFLSAVQPITGPRPSALANLVPAVSPLSNDTFQPLAASSTEHVLNQRFKIVGNTDPGRLKLENRFPTRWLVPVPRHFSDLPKFPVPTRSLCTFLFLAPLKRGTLRRNRSASS